MSVRFVRHCAAEKSDSADFFLLFFRRSRRHMSCVKHRLNRTIPRYAKAYSDGPHQLGARTTISSDNRRRAGLSLHTGAQGTASAIGSPTFTEKSRARLR